MTGFTAVLFLLLSQLPATPIDTRIVELKKVSPVTLVGLPCGDAENKLTPQKTDEENAPNFATTSFACEKDCAVGVRVKDGLHVSTFTVTTALVHDRGRVTSAVSPALTPSGLQVCNGEKFVLASMPRIAWPVKAGIVYVSEVTFENGSTWRVDANEMQNAAFGKLMKQPKKGR